MKRIIPILFAGLLLLCGCSSVENNHSGDITKYNYKICKKIIDTTDDLLNAEISLDDAIETVDEYYNSMEKGNDYDLLASSMALGVSISLSQMERGFATSEDVKKERDELSKYIGYK